MSTSDLLSKLTGGDRHSFGRVANEGVLSENTWRVLRSVFGRVEG